MAVHPEASIAAIHPADARGASGHSSMTTGGSGMFETYGFSVLEHRYNPYERMGRHRHPEAYICLVTDGGFIDTGPSGPAAADAGDILLRPGGDEHTTNCGQEGAACLKIELRDTWLSRDDASALFHDRLTLSSPHLRLYAQRIQRLMQGHDAFSAGAPLSSRLALESIVIDLLAQLVRPQTPSLGSDGNWLAKLRHAIVDDPFRRWTTSMLGAVAGRHPVHVSRAFRECYGEPVGSFFRRQRLERCHQLIMDADVDLADIATAAGYADQSHFTRAYKQAFGVTPGQARKRNDGNGDSGAAALTPYFSSGS